MRITCAAVLAATLSPGAPALAQAPEPVARPATEARVPNVLGATGLLLSPSAYIQPSGAVTPFIYGENRFVGGGAVAGIGDRLEVGGTILDGRGGFARRDTRFLANAKLSLLAETANVPAVAVGVVDAFDSLDRDPGWYVVASKYFTRGQTEQPFSLKGSLGYGGGLFGDRIFAGAELFVTPNISAMAEYVRRDFNLGARWAQGGFSATLGWFDLSHLGGGVSYSFRLR